MKSKKKLKLTPVSQKIVELIETVGDGSQRKFADKVKCSQPVISRIVNGQQQPGRDLIDRISILEGVDKTALLAKFEEPLPLDLMDDYAVPVANHLLRGTPRPENLTTRTVSVSATIFHSTLYAISARACEPASSDLSERLRSDDLIIIESSMERIHQNLQSLNGKLCAIDKGNLITLQRVWVRYDTEKSKWAIFTYPDTNASHQRDEKYNGRNLRAIDLHHPEDAPANEIIDEELKETKIVGIAIQLIRTL